MIVDVHADYIPKNFSDLMGDRFLPRIGVPMRTGIKGIRGLQGNIRLYRAAGIT